MKSKTLIEFGEIIKDLEYNHLRVENLYVDLDLDSIEAIDNNKFPYNMSFDEVSFKYLHDSLEEYDDYNPTFQKSTIYDGIGQPVLINKEYLIWANKIIDDYESSYNKYSNFIKNTIKADLDFMKNIKENEKLKIGKNNELSYNLNLTNWIIEVKKILQ